MSGENKRKADEEPIDVEAPEPKLAKQDENEHAGVAQLAPDAQAVIEEKVTTGAASALRQFFATNIAAMKNPSAYLAGVVRSIRGSSGRGDAAPRGTNSAVSKQLDFMHRKHGVLPERGVDPRACDTCHACTCRNILKPGDLDEKLMQRIHSEPEDQVMHALRLYAERVPADCRNHSAFFTSLLNNARSQLANGGGPGGYGGPMHGRMPPRGMMPPHMMMPGMPGQMRPPFRGPPGPPMMRPPFASPGRGMPSPGKGAYRGGGGGGPRDFTQEQMAEGVRVDEFHTCSEYACFVAPYAAKELQNLFDGGLGLVDMMDERAWRQLASLWPEEALDIVTEVGGAMRDKEIRNVNAFFTSVVKRKVDNLSERMRNFEDRLAGADGGGGGPPPQHIETRVYDYEAAAPRPPPPAVRPPVGGPVYGYGAGGGRGGGGPMPGGGGHGPQGGGMAAGGGYAMQPPQPNGGQVMNGAQAQQMQYAQQAQHAQAMPQHTQHAQVPMAYATSGYGVQQPAAAQQPQVGQQMQQYAQPPQQQQYAAAAAQPQQPEYQQQAQAAQQQMYQGYGSAVAAGGMQQQQQGVYSGQMAAPAQPQQAQQAQQQQQMAGGVQQGGYYAQQPGAYAQNVAAGGAPAQSAYGQHAAMPGQAQPGMQYGR